MCQKLSLPFLNRTSLSTVSQTSMFCREGYKDAASFLQHAKDVGAVKTPDGVDFVKHAMKGGSDISFSGPKAELAKIKEAMGSDGIRYLKTLTCILVPCTVRCIVIQRALSTKAVSMPCSTVGRALG